MTAKVLVPNFKTYINKKMLPETQILRPKTRSQALNIMSQKGSQPDVHTNFERDPIFCGQILMYLASKCHP